MSNQQCCSVCGKPFICLPAQSPVIHNELWQEVLDYHDLSEEERAYKNAPTHIPVYCCTECMEEALGRKITKEDVRNYPFNIYFQLHRFYGLPVEMVKKIRAYMKGYVLNSPDFKDWRLQREHAYMNGVMKILKMIQSSEYDTPELH